MYWNRKDVEMYVDVVFDQPLAKSKSQSNPKGKGNLACGWAVTKISF